jgi:ubiquinone/menaquinone biosynthesis C-methylase UbiE
MKHYYEKTACQCIIGKYNHLLPDSIKNRTFNKLNYDEVDYLISYGRNNDEQFYFFKRSMILPRIKFVLSYLHSLSFNNLLDVGSGRGAFLFPLLEEFTTIQITSMDNQPDKVKLINQIHSGGCSNINGIKQDASSMDLDDNYFDIVTALEVLEHIPDAQLAFNEMIRVARNHLIISVPSKSDNNPEHLHLLSKDVFMQWITEDNIRSIKFKELKDHLLVFIQKL